MIATAPRRRLSLPRAPAGRALPGMIADVIAEAIATGRIQAGDRVVESTLAAELKVSRVPMREALKVLQTQGILTGGGHRGLRVAMFDVTTIDRIFEVRLMLESFLLRDAIHNWRGGTSDRAELDTAVATLEEAARKGDTRASLRADLGFHRAIARAARNEVTATLWEAIARHVLIIFSLNDFRDEDLGAVTAHHRLFLRFIDDQIAEPGTLEAMREGLQDHLLLVARSKGAEVATRSAPPTVKGSRRNKAA